ncbi:MAG: M42 family metallopeptidase [Dethiobacteria bacterium]|nr:M42 family metallopeptidase [Bacillota bacterium]
MLLKTLAELPGVSGDEKRVREAIKKEVQPYVDELKTDCMGNLIVNKRPRKGKKRSPKVMLAAHMDEVGLIINGIEKSGHLRFLKVGDIDNRVLISKPVIIGVENIPGVIGVKAVHLQKPDERKKTLKTNQLYIDIGAKGKEEAEKMVSLGDYAAFDTKVKEMGERCLCGKAFDNRAGCAVLVELLKRELPVELCAVFTVQEEIGSRGAITAAYTLDPDLALIIETTSAADFPETKGIKPVTNLGDGPALTLMDQSFISDGKILAALRAAAEDNEIKYQYRRFTSGATDAGNISLSKEGIPAGVVSIPCRYLHSPASVIKLDDFYATIGLSEAFLHKVSEMGGLNR